MPNGVSALQSVDLSGSYTTAATPSVRLQVAKQGYRYVVPHVLSLFLGEIEGTQI